MDRGLKYLNLKSYEVLTKVSVFLLSRVDTQNTSLAANVCMAKVLG